MLNKSCVLLVAVACTVGPTAQTSQKPTQTITKGMLDEIRLYATAPPPNTVSVTIQPFSATDADLAEGGQKGALPKETRDLQERAPRLLASSFVSKLKELGSFKDVTVSDSPASAGLLVEGKFTTLDPGSRAKRYLVGFGAGKSTVSVIGSVKNASGALAASFAQKRIGVMGLAGGDSTAKLVGDSQSIGEDIAKFLNAWVTGKNLK